jgi:predicted nucleic acid-binding protein
VLSFLAKNDAQLFLSTIVLAEMEFGIAKAVDPVRRSRLATLRQDIVERCGDRVLTPDGAAAAVWGMLKARLEAAGQPIADIDLLIASQAIAGDMPLATRNVSDMARTGATILNPWQA